MKKISPDVAVKIVAMREVGYSIGVIASKFGCSSSTVKRICLQHNASKGCASEEMMEQSREALRKAIGGDSAIQEIAAAVYLDTKQHSEEMRAKLGEALSMLVINNAEDAKNVIRLMTPYANALKLSTDAIRSALKIDTTDRVDEDELPSLVIECISDEEVSEIRRQQAMEDRELFGYGEEGEEEADIVEYH